jgi:long-chain acyl-CoA synthetase
VLYEAGLRPGDVVALLTENHLRAFEVYRAALRSGLYITAVNNRLKPDEVAYIVSDSGATALIVSAEQGATAEAIAALTTGVKLRLAYGGPVKDHGSVKSKIASFKAPRTVRFVDELPRSEAGKLMKSRLKAMYAQG